MKQQGKKIFRNSNRYSFQLVNDVFDILQVIIHDWTFFLLKCYQSLQQHEPLWTNVQLILSLEMLPTFIWIDVTLDDPNQRILDIFWNGVQGKLPTFSFSSNDETWWHNTNIIHPNSTPFMYLNHCEWPYLVIRFSF